MKYIVLVLIVMISTSTYGQDKPKVIAKYQDVERMGNFITRFYYDLTGTSLIWKSTLTLYSDSTYHYVYKGGVCGTFDEDRRGSWTVENDTLKLSLDVDGFFWQYIMANNKLYDIQTDPVQNSNAWIMKLKGALTTL